MVAHRHDTGRQEIKTGCLSTTRTRVPRRRPDLVEIRAEAQSYLAAQTEAETCGWHLWAEACRRGVDATTEVVVLGDGAHWISNIADTHFPQATQIVDWYHASQSVWDAATAFHGDAEATRAGWVRTQLDALWNGQIDTVMDAVQPHAGRKEAVNKAISDDTAHRSRMDYPTYRARELQIGSGTIESACKQLVRERLKLVGMIWDADGAEAVAVVRAWLKSDRWDGAMRLRPPPCRTYQ